MVNVADNEDETTFDEFCEEWLSEFRNGDLSPSEKGQGFAIKMVTQWLSVTGDDEDFIICDGSGDGGIDIAYLHRADIDDGEQDSQSVGDTWYVIQSKYGTAFQGAETIVKEGRKVIATLAGENTHLSENVTQLMGRLDTFRQKASEQDRIVLVFATERPITESDRQALNEIRLIGRQRVGDVFDVVDMSLQTIWEAMPITQQASLSLPIHGNFVDPSPGLRVGTVSLTDLYQFLKAYQSKTGNLDQLYEKNVRQFLGTRRKVNKGIRETLADKPDMFGLYNNGITIVVSGITTDETDGSCLLYEPNVVNGCQTTRTIWQVLTQKFESGGTGESEALEAWRERAKRGVVVTKIVESNNAEIGDITKFTNSQNAVKDQDFVVLRDDFRAWKSAMENHYGIFLEIQRGGWDARKAYQKSHPSTRQFAESANAFDLIKVLGAGWLGEPGTAFNKNAPFIPGRVLFQGVTNRNENDDEFGVLDLYAAFKLKIAADSFGFGRAAQHVTRRQTRFLFYSVTMKLLRGILVAGQRDESPGALTKAFLKLSEPEHQEVISRLLESAVNLVDDYLTAGSELCAHKEPVYNHQFNQDMNGFLKWDNLGKGDHTPILTQLFGDYQRDSRRKLSSDRSLADSIYSTLDG